MVNYNFNYLKEFKCLAGKCNHSCCVGWEISLDRVAIKKYKKVKGGFLSSIEKGIDYKSRSIKLTDKRCPFLNSENLCEIIINLGEDYLSEICTLHPRFKNFFSARTETGLGLSCEEACRIILFKTREQRLERVNGKKERLKPFEKEILSFREEVLNIIDENSDVLKAIEELKDFIGFIGKINYVKLYEFLFNLERLDKSWEEYLAFIKSEQNVTCEDYGFAYKNLLTYFIYRHVSNAIDKFDLKIKTAFSVIATTVIIYMSNGLRKEKGELKEGDLIDIARSFSSEIEYSDNNLNAFYEYVERIYNLKE